MQTKPVRTLEPEADGRKPLYLGGGAGLSVDLDGPALRVRRSERAVSWFPLARLARVVSIVTVHWQYSALLACADQGVPVVFVDRAGDVHGYLFGRAVQQTERFWRLCLLASGSAGSIGIATGGRRWRNARHRHSLGNRDGKSKLETRSDCGRASAGEKSLCRCGARAGHRKPIAGFADCVQRAVTQ
ncbi:MAG: hypothetical protein HC808_18385 [Candidatus Competibacteraceae bacterium]|nr:hypothetical protein [Candidatus Competibacteraceae bacterium]